MHYIFPLTPFPSITRGGASSSEQGGARAKEMQRWAKSLIWELASFQGQKWGIISQPVLKLSLIIICVSCPHLPLSGFKIKNCYLFSWKNYLFISSLLLWKKYLCFLYCCEGVIYIQYIYCILMQEISVCFIIVEELHFMFTLFL